METSTEQKTAPVKIKRQVATQIFVFYKDKDSGENGLTQFDYKEDLDKWLASTSVEVLRIIRGVEKKIAVQAKVTFV